MRVMRVAIGAYQEVWADGAPYNTGSVTRHCTSWSQFGGNTVHLNYRLDA